MPGRPSSDLLEVRPDYGPPGCGAGAGGPPMVLVGELTAIQVRLVRSNLYPGAWASTSLVEFMTSCQLLLSFFLNRIVSKATATSFSPTPRKPPTPTMKALILPS